MTSQHQFYPRTVNGAILSYTLLETCSIFLLFIYFFFKKNRVKIPDVRRVIKRLLSVINKVSLSEVLLF